MTNIQKKQMLVPINANGCLVTENTWYVNLLINTLKIYLDSKMNKFQ